MQKKTFVSVSLFVGTVFICLFVLRSTMDFPHNSTSKESMEECGKKNKETKPNSSIIWESLSHQFFSFSDATY